MEPDEEGRHGASTGRPRTPQHKFHRAYKACIKCRARKTRCDISAQAYSAGLPCARCRREMRECVFPTERQNSTPKPRQKSKRAGQPHQLTEPTDCSEIAADSRADQQSPVSNRQTTSASAVGDEDQPNLAGTEQTQPQQSDISPRTTGLSGESAPGEVSDRHVFPSNISNSMMRTVVSNGNDALNLLFEAARHEGAESSQSGISTDVAGPNRPSPIQMTSQNETGVSVQSSLYGLRPSACALSVNLSDQLVETWKAYRFVRMGWLSAEEAVTYIDLFFQNMAPLSPILDDFYSHHCNHYWLVVREPLLCCMILMISARYHPLPVPGGESRGFLIHQRLWDHCQHLLMRIMLGQEKESKAKTRTVGSIEALILLTEWQPRGLHAPPAPDGWDSDVLHTITDERDDGAMVESPSRGRWREDVINPARRFDRMSWMALGIAVTLAHELGVFDNENAPAVDLERLSEYEKRLRDRRVPLATMLLTYQEQLSCRLGRRSVVPQSVIHSVTNSTPLNNAAIRSGTGRKTFLVAWAELTKLMRSISDMLFPSSFVTKHLLQSGRYVSMIEHFTSLLSVWESQYLRTSVATGYLADILTLEYQYAKAYANSLGLQAIVEGTLAESGEDPTRTLFYLTPTDYAFISAVVDSCLNILQLASKLSEKGTLRFAPITVFLRITSASVFLLKGLGLGVSLRKLRDAMGILTRAIEALRNSKPDDLHLGSRYATLLEIHVVHLQESFIPATRPPRFATRPASIERQVLPDASYNDVEWNLGFGGRLDGLASVHFGSENTEVDESWLTLPFDPSLVPFAPDDFQEFQGLGNNSMDFIWNLSG